MLVPLTAYLGSYGACCLFPREEPLIGRIAHPTRIDTPGRVANVCFRPLITVHESWAVRRAAGRMEGVWIWTGGTWGDVFPERIEIVREGGRFIRFRSLDPVDSNEWRTLRIGGATRGYEGRFLAREFVFIDEGPGRMRLKKFDWGYMASYDRL